MSSYLEKQSDTICAPITPMGMGAVSVLRMSGSSSAQICRKIFSNLPTPPQSHHIYYGWILDTESKSKIDEVLVSYFSEGKSFTGEESIEISTHGSPVLVREIMRLLVANGCRIAERGEFTFRAVMNGKLDLVQAEGILSLIQANSLTAAKISLRQLEGALSKKFQYIETSLLGVLAEIEASIDFSTEDIQAMSIQGMATRLEETISFMQSLSDGFRGGQIVTNGLRAIIVGPPNAGKSSLMNLLLGQDKSIISSTPGTTRDIVSGSFICSGCVVEVLDTAGIREAKEEVESIGIAKAKRALDEADICILMFDIANPELPLVFDVLSTMRAERVILVANKADQIDPNQNSEKLLEAIKFLQTIVNPAVQKALKDIKHVSCKKEQGVAGIVAEIEKYLGEVLPNESAVVSQVRQSQLLIHAIEKTVVAMQLLKQEASWEFVGFELQQAMRFVQEIFGKEFDDQIMDQVFQQFCIGK